MDSVIQGTSGGTEKRRKTIEIKGVQEWEIEKILNKRKNKRSGQIFSAMEGVYSRT